MGKGTGTLVTDMELRTTWGLMAAIMLWVAATALLIYLMFGSGGEHSPLQYLFMFLLGAAMTASARHCLTRHNEEMHDLQRMLYDARAEGLRSVKHHNTC